MVPPSDDSSKSLGDNVTNADAHPSVSVPDPMEGSLGDGGTLDGATPVSDTQSLGDVSTLGDLDRGDMFEDDMEVVDLSARYTIQGQLGQGGMGEVLLATDTRLNRQVAIKRILGDAATRQTAVSRFLTEAQSIAAINHPNIVQIYDYGRATDGPFLIMEYVEGGNLLDRCREEPLPLEEAIHLTCQLCDGLAKAHDANIIHRDIKPANILMSTDGLPKLTDFGLAKDETADGGLSVAGAVLGTLDFMPPEQRRDAALVDARSDLWSLAATFYQMVTGKSPRVIRFNDVPVSVQEALGKALEDGKDDRYQTARDFRDALRLSQTQVGPEELEEGDCPACGTKNPSHRRYCRNEKCGEDLQVPCLSCNASIPLWESVCDGCGAKQVGLVKAQREQLDGQRQHAIEYLSVLKFPEAENAATGLSKKTDHRFREFHQWATEFLETVDAKRTEAHGRLEELMKECDAHENVNDYQSAIRVLEQTHKQLATVKLPNRSETVDARLTRLIGVTVRIKKLSADIRSRINSGQLDGLLTQVEALLTLTPHRSDLADLRSKLTIRDSRRKQQLLDTCRGEYARLISDLRYKDAISFLTSLNERDGHDFPEFVSWCDEALQSTRKSYEPLREQWDTMEAEVVSAVSAGDFSRAKQLAESIPPSELTYTAKLALEEGTSNVRRIKQLRQRIKQSMADRHFDDAALCLEELLLLQPNDHSANELRDRLDGQRERKERVTELQRQEKTRKSRAQIRRKELAATTTRAAYWLVVVAVAGLLIYTGVAWWKAADTEQKLVDALISEDWDQALQLDQTSMTALMGRASTLILTDPIRALSLLDKAQVVTSADIAVFDQTISRLDSDEIELRSRLESAKEKESEMRHRVKELEKIYNIKRRTDGGYARAMWKNKQKELDTLVEQVQQLNALLFESKQKCLDVKNRKQLFVTGELRRQLVERATNQEASLQNASGDDGSGQGPSPPSSETSQNGQDQ